uniref:Uncharacterized protein n=1 Tax=Anopheles coluzzii TaxID=1518534 RepID=A0A8W7P3L4_ANOCL
MSVYPEWPSGEFFFGGTFARVGDPYPWNGYFGYVPMVCHPFNHVEPLRQPKKKMPTVIIATIVIIIATIVGDGGTMLLSTMSSSARKAIERIDKELHNDLGDIGTMVRISEQCRLACGRP